MGGTEVRARVDLSGAATPPPDDRHDAAPGRGLVDDPRLRLVLLVTATVAAYQHSLVDLSRTLGYDTPLAYLGIVPVLALALGVSRARGHVGVGAAPHRHADWIIGVPMLVLAGWVAFVLPDRLGYSFWTNRIDLLGLPLFVAGLTALLFGARVLRRVLPAVVLSAFAWPFPYERIIDDLLVAAQTFTLAAVRLVAGSVGARNTADALFQVGEGAGAFVVNVAPQCAGASSAVGWLLLGSTVCLAIAPGRRVRKGVWLFTGLAVLVAANVARIAGIFAVGATFGEQVAIGYVHPYVGLVIFVTAVAVMVRLLPRFGLPALNTVLPASPPRTPAGDGPRRLTPPTLVVVCLAAVLLHPVNATLDRFDPFRDVTATNAAAPFATVSQALDGYQGTAYDSIEWGRQYFGRDSTWIRHRYQASAMASPLYVDVIATSDLRTFTEFGVEACYRFHDYGIVDQGRVDVGAAAPAQHLTFFNLDTGTWWSALAVVQATDDAGRRRYERILALVPLGGNDPDVAPDDDRIDEATRELVAFARTAVRATAPTA